MVKQSIYIKVLNELEKKYIFTRYGLERRYNNMLKLKQSAVDIKLIELIDEVLKSYSGLLPEKEEVDLDKFDIRKYLMRHIFNYTRDRVMALLNSKISRENLRSYCTAAKAFSGIEVTINKLHTIGKTPFVCSYNSLYTLDDVDHIIKHIRNT